MISYGDLADQLAVIRISLLKLAVAFEYDDGEAVSHFLNDYLTDIDSLNRRLHRTVHVVSNEVLSEYNGTVECYAKVRKQLEVFDSSPDSIDQVEASIHETLASILKTVLAMRSDLSVERLSDEINEVIRGEQ